MKLKHGLHLAYSTNIHRGESWVQTFDSLERYTLAVRQRICPGQPYAIGLRLSDRASRELSDPLTLSKFQKWLDQQQCYIFTINGFPYGQFHGHRVKEQVYAPDWSTQQRLQYTNRLFDLLAQLVPPQMEGSVSTVPVSFKEFIRSQDQLREARKNLWLCIDHIAEVSERTSKRLHLGLEPEPLCYLETSRETVEFFEQLAADRPGDPKLLACLGVNYDTCHLAVEFEEPQEAVNRFQRHGIRISKFHFSNALKAQPTPEARQALRRFADDIYFHQVIFRSPDGALARFKDLDLALASASALGDPAGLEWRIHFHIPLHSPPNRLFSNTADHILGIIDILRANPGLCTHIEMETYTWEVMPPELKNRDVVDQLVGEYRWTMQKLAERGLA